MGAEDKRERSISAAQKVTVEGKDYEEAVANMNHLFLKNMWSDGLPLLPPTEERVNWILTGTDLPRDTVVGQNPAQRRNSHCRNACCRSCHGRRAS